MGFFRYYGTLIYKRNEALYFGLFSLYIVTEVGAESCKCGVQRHGQLDQRLHTSPGRTHLPNPVVSAAHSTKTMRQLYDLKFTGFFDRMKLFGTRLVHGGLG